MKSCLHSRPLNPTRRLGHFSRRRALGQLSAGLAAGLGVTTGAARAATQDATPTALPPLLQQLIDATNAGDGAALAALYTEDGSHEDVPAGVLAQGREEIAAYVNGVFVQFPDLRLEPIAGNLNGELAVLEYTLSATDPASGRPVVYRGVLIFELDGTQIRRSADYYDYAAILGQLGLLPELEPAGTPAP